MSIFQELLKSFAGGPTSATIGQFERDAVRGGRDVLGIESLPVDPNSVMSAPPAEQPISESLMSIAPALSALLPVEQQAAAPDVAPVGKTSARRAPGTGGGASKGSASAPKDIGFDDLIALSQRGVDRTGQKGDLEAQRNALMAKSESERDFSDEEKVATALLAALPGLLGAIGGGAIAGGYGAAAGAAGGLQGGAQGVQMIAAGKESKRKEAKGDADKLADRIAVLDEKIADQQEKMQDKELSLKLQKRAEEKAAGLAAEKNKLDRELANLSSRTQITTTGMAQKGAMDRARLDAANDLKKAQFAASAGRKPDDSDKAFFTNSGNGMRAVSDIRGLVDAGGADIGAHLSNSGNAHLLDQKVAELSHALTKIGDPNSAVLLAELQSTKETLLANPHTTRTDIFLRKVAEAEKRIVNTAIDYSTVSGIPLNPEIEHAFGSPAASPPGQSSVGKIDLHSKYGF